MPHNYTFILDNILQNVSRDYLISIGSSEYFRSLADNGPISSRMLPPEHAKEVFMECGNIEKNSYQIGIIVKKGDLFVKDHYTHEITEISYNGYYTTNARSTNKFYTYYSDGTHNPIGFSPDRSIDLSDNYDKYNYDDGLRLSAYTSGMFS